MNQHNQIVAQNLAQGFIDHRYVGLGPKRISKLSLHHAKGRFDVRPLMIVSKEFIASVHEQMVHPPPCLDFEASLFSSVAGTAVSFERNVSRSSAILNIPNIVVRQISF